ncbi:MAG: VanZ family protein [Phycisphaerales bacterium]
MPSNRMQRCFHRRWFIASFLSLALVLLLTHIPQEAVPRVLQRHMLDKVEHIIAYGLIALLFLLSLPNPVRSIPAAAGLVALAGVGILDETTQPFVNRIASVGDYLSDLIGIGLACVVFLVLKRFRPGGVSRQVPVCSSSSTD